MMRFGVRIFWRSARLGWIRHNGTEASTYTSYSSSRTHLDRKAEVGVSASKYERVSVLYSSIYCWPGPSSMFERIWRSQRTPRVAIKSLYATPSVPFPNPGLNSGREKADLHVHCTADFHRRQDAPLVTSLKNPELVVGDVLLLYKKKARLKPLRRPSRKDGMSIYQLSSCARFGNRFILLTYREVSWFNLSDSLGNKHK